MSEAPKLWRIIAGRTVREKDSCVIREIEHEFIVEGESLNEVWKQHERLLSGYEYIKASVVEQ